MSTLGTKKKILLNQLILRKDSVSLDEVKKLLTKYEDLVVADLKGFISDDMYDILVNMKEPNPEALKLWSEILRNKEMQDEVSLRNAQSKLQEYIRLYHDEPNIDEAIRLVEDVDKKLKFITEEAHWQNLNKNDENALKQYKSRFPESVHMSEIESVLVNLKGSIEQKAWDECDKSNYSSLKMHLSRFPESIHLDEIDDYMWQAIKKMPPSSSVFQRYLNDLPEGKHVEEAYSAMDTIKDWENLKRSPEYDDKIVKVKKYMEDHPNSPFINDVRSMYYELKDKVLKKMKANPTKFDKSTVEDLIEEEIFTEWELMDNNLMTQESWDILRELNRDLYPNLAEFQIENEEITAPEGCTDVFLFGTPGTGKTCLLMGLAGANGSGYSLNMKVNGGPYASALQQYVYAGITPGHTFGNYVTTINGQVREEYGSNKVIYHNVNFVEMSGEEFALRIADQDEVSLANMGTGATRLMQNSNRKVFFIVIDCSADMVEVNYLDEVRDEEGYVIAEQSRIKRVSQLDILNKFVSLFTLPENQHIMKNVDAIHFVVTKADMLGDRNERMDKVRDLLLNNYRGPVEQLKAYCRQTKRINFNTGYSPLAYPFSLGQFYLGDIFKFDKMETMQIIDVIRHMTSGTKERSWWDRFKEIFG